MPMKNPCHPGELVGDALEELGWGIAPAAKAMGVSRQHLHKIIAGRSNITAEMALRLEKAIGSTAETWLTMQKAWELAQARKNAGDINVSRLEPRAA